METIERVGANPYGCPPRVYEMIEAVSVISPDLIQAIAALGPGRVQWNPGDLRITNVRTADMAVRWLLDGEPATIGRIMGAWKQCED